MYTPLLRPSKLMFHYRSTELEQTWFIQREVAQLENFSLQLKARSEWNIDKMVQRRHGQNIIY